MVPSAGSTNQKGNPMTKRTIPMAAFTAIFLLLATATAHDPSKHGAKAGAAHEPTPDELAAFAKAKPVFEKNCFRCHTTAGKKAKAKSLEHMKMDGYPFGGHHADMAGMAIRDAIKGKDGKDPTMPKDDPGAVTGADLDAVLAWAAAWDHAHGSGMSGAGGMAMDHAGHEGHAPGASAVAGATVYTCPMHPEVRSDKPGRCPKCGMNLVAVATKASPPAAPADPALVAVVDGWHRALADRSVDKLAQVVDESLLVLEGTHKNVGWADFRDNHIGPEMKDWTEFKLIEGRVIEASASGALGYGVWEGVMRITAAGKPATLQVAETFVFTKAAVGWRIKHVHMAMKKAEGK